MSPQTSKGGNPWEHLPAEAPYILEQDRDDVDDHNASAPAKFRVHPELLPVPFIGNPRAPVVLLNLNPGYSPDDEETEVGTPFGRALRANLTHGNPKFPFPLIDPRFGDVPGYEWWSTKLRPLIAAVGEKTVAKRVFCVQLFPYRSAKYRAVSVPSQSYGAELVTDALKRGALIVGMRSCRQWEERVPSLIAHPKVAWLKNPRNPQVSPGNMEAEAYAAVVSALRGK